MTTANQENFVNIARIHTIFNYVGKLTEGLSLFLIAIILARGLSVSDYGFYSILIEALKIAVLLGSMGIPAILTRFLPELIENNEIKAGQTLIKGGLFINIVAQILVICIFAALSPQISKWLNLDQLNSVVWVFSACLISHAIVNTCNQVANGLLLQKFSNIFNATSGLLKLGFIFFALQNGYGIRGILWSIFIVNATHLLSLSILIFKKFLLKKEKVIKSYALKYKRFFRYGIFSYFNETTASIFEISTDIFIIGYFLDKKEVALYAFAATTVPLLMNWLPTRISSNLLLPLFVRQVKRSADDDHEVNFIYQIIVKTLTILSIPASVGIIVLGPEIITLVFDPKFIKAYEVLIIFAAFAAINECLTMAALVASLKEKPDIMFYSRIFTVYNLIMDIILVGPFGIKGVALATTSALFGKGLFIYFSVKRIAEIKLPFLALFKISIGSLLMASAIIITKQFWGINTLWELICIVLLGTILYLLIMSQIKVFNERDRDIIQGILKIKNFPF